MRYVFLTGLFSVILTMEAAAYDRPTATCRHGANVFSLAIHPERDGRACETTASSGNAKPEVMWVSVADADLCRRKADSLIKLLSASGWDCDQGPLTIAARDD